MSFETSLKKLGRIPYAQALEEQNRIISIYKAHCASRSVGLIAFEAEPVVTLGIRTQDFFAGSLPTLKVDRGGEATYHGPGQVLFFPIAHLPTWNLGVTDWVKFLLDVTERTLKVWEIGSKFDLSRPGVFTSVGKIASIGLKIRGGWSTHGIALNVKGNFDAFAAIPACGVWGAPVDQVSHWHQSIEMSEVISVWKKQFDLKWNESLVGPTKVDRARLFRENLGRI